MSFAARGGAAHLQLPLGQLALVGLGAFCIANPDKFFYSLAQGAAFLQAPAPNNQQGSVAPSQPIIIHQSAPATGGSSTAKGFVIRLVGGAVLCWGSYIVLVTVLPEQAKELLPVNRKVFNQAITSLGNAVLNLKDTLMEQINALSIKQDDLSDKQDRTHTEVLDIKDNVQDVRGDISAVQEALDLCHASLSESERRTSYIARGVQLLSRGVSTILPEDEHLLTELARFNLAGEEFRGPAPMQQRRLQEISGNLRRTEQAAAEDDEQAAENRPTAEIVIRPPSTINSLESPFVHGNNSSDPENDHPIKNLTTPDHPVEQSVAGIHTLLHSVGGRRLYSVGDPRKTII